MSYVTLGKLCGFSGLIVNFIDDVRIRRVQTHKVSTTLSRHSVLK